MKRFALKIALFFLLLIVGMGVLLVFFGGYVDYYYVKFTSPRQHSLILGDSRSMEGIRPSVMDEALSDRYELPMFNYSFALAHATYGPAYLQSVKRKLDPETSNGLFVLSVSPWVLSTRENDDEANGVYFEDDGPPNNVLFPNMNPNFEYLVKNFELFHFKAMFRQRTQTHRDGWIEQQPITDSSALKELRAVTLKLTRNNAGRWKPSPYRLASLDSTVAYLQRFGTVVLVRMPAGKEMAAEERQYWSSFDAEINQMARKRQLRYFNFLDADYYSYDGSHLDPGAQVAFTKALCDSVLTIKAKPKK